MQHSLQLAQRPSRRASKARLRARPCRPACAAARSSGVLDSYAKALAQAIALSGSSGVQAFARAFAVAQSDGGASSQVGGLWADWRPACRHYRHQLTHNRTPWGVQWLA